MSDRTYYDLSIGQIDTDTVPQGDDKNRYIGCVVDEAAMPTPAELEEAQDSNKASVEAFISDDAPTGDGIALKFRNSMRDKETGLIFAIYFTPEQTRVLHAALGAVLMMREAQAGTKQ